jgi:DNA-binding Lrp family transcriptional regulator
MRARSDTGFMAGSGTVRNLASPVRSSFRAFSPPRPAISPHPPSAGGTGRFPLPRRETSASLSGESRQAPPPLPETEMVPFFVMIKCHLGKAYQVANAIADAEIASEIYSTAGDYDLLVKFYVDDDADIGHFVNEKVHPFDGILDTKTLITFKAF